MRKTSVYLDDRVWEALRVQAEREDTTVSALSREAVQQRCLEDREKRGRAMRAFIGAGRSMSRQFDSASEVSRLRRDNRIKRLYER